MLLSPPLVQSQLLIDTGDDYVRFSRSIESLRDLDYQTWQVVAYREGLDNKSVILRIVGYPGTMRFDHPTDLFVHSGRRDWALEDITIKNTKLVEDPREAAAEFVLEPLLADLRNNRPLRLKLPGVFGELPVPPYLVSEWRSLLLPEPLDEQLDK